MRFPSSSEVVEAFAGAGLEYVATDAVRHRFADTFAEYAARLRLRAISTFEYLTEEEIGEGFAAIGQVTQLRVGTSRTRHRLPVHSRIITQLAKLRVGSAPPLRSTVTPYTGRSNVNRLSVDTLRTR